MADAATPADPWPLGRDDAEQIYTILIDTCAAPVSLRADFLAHHTDPQPPAGPSEFRFCGALGFGGKFRVDPHHPAGWYVDQYPEDVTGRTLAMVDSANRQLAELRTARDKRQPA